LVGVQRELLGAHFLLLAGLLRKSARSDYAHMAPQDLMERRIVLTLFRLEDARVSQLASILGNDTGQVSRALGSLRKAGAVSRERQRDPYRLTDQGQELAELMQTVVIRRERQLTRGFEPLELFELGGLLANLLQRASSLWTEESSRAGEGEEFVGDLPLEGGPAEIHSRLHPAIVGIATSIGRSATLAFKRLAGLSSYEWRILANIAYRPSVSFSELVLHIYSDKAQVSRALDAMVQRGLVSRSGGSRPGERRGLNLTAEGQRLHDIMETDSLRRNAILAADMKPAQRDRLQTYLDRLVSNATAMVTDIR
jgi:DNA-binding MarR family transcriptional regulator